MTPRSDDHNGEEGGDHQFRLEKGGGTVLRQVERRSTQMIRVTVEMHEGAVTRRVQISATSIERALRIVGDGTPGRRMPLLFSIDPEVLLVPKDFGRREAA
jgi:hypothetical protein